MSYFENINEARNAEVRKLVKAMRAHRRVSKLKLARIRKLSRYVHAAKVGFIWNYEGRDE